MNLCARLREIFYYCQDTGQFTWRMHIGGTSKIGAIAGCTDGEGYRILSFDGLAKKAHRMAWLYVYGEIPDDMEMDHINGDKSDNRLTNLRLATRRENRRNGPRHRDNASGFKGVVFQTHTKTNPWRALITFEKKTVHLGNFSDPYTAHQAYAAAARKYYGEFARTA